MHKAPQQAPVTTDYHLYGDKMSTGPRYMATPVSRGTVSTFGLLYGQYLGKTPTDMSFTSASLYVDTANSAAIRLGIFTGPTVESLTLQESGSPIVIGGSVVSITFPSLYVPRSTVVVVGIILDTGTTAPLLGGFNPSNGTCQGLVGAVPGAGLSKYSTTVGSMPAAIDLTYNWTAVSSNIWVALS